MAWLQTDEKMNLEGEVSFDKPRTASLTAEWALQRAEVILANMAEENTGLWASLLGRRWPISHEPLRGDARNALPEIRRAIVKLRAARGDTEPNLG